MLIAYVGGHSRTMRRIADGLENPEYVDLALKYGRSETQINFNTPKATIVAEQKTSPEKATTQSLY